MQFFTGFEAHRFAGGNADLGASAGVAANAGFAGPNAEDAKPAQLDALTGCEGLFQTLKDGIHRGLSLGAGQARALNHVMDDILLNQSGYLAGAPTA